MEQVPFIGESGPGGVTCGDVEFGGVLGLFVETRGDPFREALLGQRAPDQRLDLAPQRIAIEALRDLRPVLLHGPPLHEQPLHRI